MYSRSCGLNVPCWRLHIQGTSRGAARQCSGRWGACKAADTITYKVPYILGCDHLPAAPSPRQSRFTFSCEAASSPCRSCGGSVVEAACATSANSTLRCTDAENKLLAGFRAQLRQRPRWGCTNPFPMMEEQWLPVAMSRRLRMPRLASARCMRTLDAAGTVASSLLCSRTTCCSAAHALAHAASRSI